MGTIGDCIAADRQRLGLSQQELARLVGVTQQAIAKWEAGRSAPRGRNLKALASTLGKKSQTAERAARTLRSPDETERQAVQPLPHSEQAQAMEALAAAARDLALAAQAIAETAQRLAASHPPPPKH